MSLVPRSEGYAAPGAQLSGTGQLSATPAPTGTPQAAGGLMPGMPGFQGPMPMGGQMMPMPAGVGAGPMQYGQPPQIPQRPGQGPYGGIGPHIGQGRPMPGQFPGQGQMGQFPGRGPMGGQPQPQMMNNRPPSGPHPQFNPGPQMQQGFAPQPTGGLQASSYPSAMSAALRRG